MSETITKPEWKPWKYGWGENLQINKWLTLTVYKSTSRDEQFGWSFLDSRSKPNIPTMEEAKKAGMAFALKVLEDGVVKLS